MTFSAWSEEMMENWKQAQQQYWNTISGQSGAAETDKTPEKSQLTQGLEQWWAVINPLLPEQSNDVMKRVFDMGKSCTQFIDDTANASSDGMNPADLSKPLESWFSAMEKGFTEWSEQAAQGSSAFTSAAPDRDIMQGWQSILDSLKNIPDEKLQGISGLAEQYSAALQTYMTSFSAQGLDSLSTLRQRVEAMPAEGASIESLRELYELWVDVGEEAYSKFAMSTQHQEIYGDLVNTFTALKAGIDALVEPQLKSLNIITQKDLDEVHKQLQQSKRDNEALRRQLSEVEKRLSVLEASCTPAKPATSQPAAKPAPKPVKAAPEPAKPVAPKAAEPAPKPAESKPDDLTVIKGIGPVMSQKLGNAGIQTFEQLAALSADQAAAIDKQLGARNRLLSEDWVGQAAAQIGTKPAA